MPAEFDLINWIRRQTPASSTLLVPPGDDLAVLKWDSGDLLLVGCDQVLDGVHFDSTIHSPRQIGRKAMNRNLSDCAAMACLPAGAVVSVALPRNVGLEFSRELYLGLRDAGNAFNCPIVGGDTGSWDGKLAVSVSILGRSAGVAPITRAGAKVGDTVYVTGPLGGSLAGRHMTFEPRIELARLLAATGKVTAMIDISDGLSRDLAHVCNESGVGAVLDGDSIPIHPDANSLDNALHDGEDYELIVCSGMNLEGISARVTRVGQITREPGIWLQQGPSKTPLVPSGWEHSL